MPAIVAGLVVSFSNPLLHADIIANGSFEAPVVTPGGFQDFSSGSSGITGWTVVGVGVSIVSGTFSQGCCTFPAQDGVQWLDLTGDGANSAEGVEQTVATSIGTEYTLTFWVGNIYDPSGIFGTTSSVKVFLGGISGTLLDTVTNSSTTSGTQIWQQFTEHFTATGSSTTIDFINNDPSGDNSNGLDNVALVANVPAGPSVPEPVMLPLIGAGLAGLIFLRRRVPG
jgi:hypothetical protein